MTPRERRAKALGLKIVGSGTTPRADWIFPLDQRLGGALVQLVRFQA